MIKSLLDADEKPTEEIKAKREEETVAADSAVTDEDSAAQIDSAVDENFAAHFAGIELPPSSLANLPDISEPADDKLIVSEKPKAPETAEPPAETSAEIFNYSEPEPGFHQTEYAFAETPVQEPPAERADNEPLAGFPVGEMNYDLPLDATAEKFDAKFFDEKSNEPSRTEFVEAANETINPETSGAATANDNEPLVVPPTEKPKTQNQDLLFYPPVEERESFAETARKSGLAYAAAITLFASVVFMMIVGWFADLLFGSSPWGIVGGIVFGAAIGFFQFVRLTSQIFRK